MVTINTIPAMLKEIYLNSINFGGGGGGSVLGGSEVVVLPLDNFSCFIIFEF
jgi:hypothetical protein